MTGPGLDHVSYSFKNNVLSLFLFCLFISCYPTPPAFSCLLLPQEMLMNSLKNVYTFKVYFSF